MLNLTVARPTLPEGNLLEELKIGFVDGNAEHGGDGSVLISNLPSQLRVSLFSHTTSYRIHPWQVTHLSQHFFSHSACIFSSPPAYTYPRLVLRQSTESLPFYRHASSLLLPSLYDPPPVPFDDIADLPLLSRSSLPHDA